MWLKFVVKQLRDLSFKCTYIYNGVSVMLDRELSLSRICQLAAIISSEALELNIALDNKVLICWDQIQDKKLR